MKRFLVLGILVFGVGLALTLAYLKSLSDHAPDVEYQLIDGSKIKQRELGEQISIINFWSASCPPCIEEMPDLESLHQRFKDRATIIGVIAPRDRPDVAIAMVKKAARSRSIPPLVRE